MPSGYTAGIIDGSINSFADFAKLCIRAFGAAVHLRDESLDTPYTPRVPGTYHIDKIAESKALLNKANTSSDEELIEMRRNELDAAKKHHVEALDIIKKNKQKLQDILEQAEAYEPPTPDHEGIKDFMIKQLDETIRFDCNSSWHEAALIDADAELINLNADSIRAKMIEEANKKMNYHETALNKEIEVCSNSNKWVEDFIASLPKTNLL